MPKTPSQYESYAKKPLSLGGTRDASGLDTTPIYSRALFLANRTRLHMEIEYYQDSSSTVTELEVGMVFHWDKDAAAEEWRYVINPSVVVDFNTGGVITDRVLRVGMPDRQTVFIPGIKSGDRTHYLSFMFDLGKYGPRYPFGRCEVFAKTGSSDPDDDMAFRLPYGDGEWHEPPDHTGGDPGSGEGGDIDP